MTESALAGTLKRMRVAFVGARSGVPYPVLDRVFRSVLAKHPNFTLVSGGAGGVDSQSEELAYAYGCEVKIYPADWKGRSSVAAAARAARNARQIDPIAGFLRNSCILGAHRTEGDDPCPPEHLTQPPTDAVVAFMEAGSKGTRDTVHKAIKGGLPLMLHSLAGERWEHCPCTKPEKLHPLLGVVSEELPLP